MAQADTIDNIENERLSNRMREARQRAKQADLKGEGLSKKNRKIGKAGSKLAKKKIAQGSEGIFIALLFIALIIDLIEYLDLGTFSALANIGIYVLVIVSGFVLYFFKDNSSRLNVFNLLKGQIWKYAVIPLFEMVPFINLIPFWTGTVLLLWLKVRREKKKIMAE